MAGEEAFEEAGIEGEIIRNYESFKTPLSKAKRLHLYPMNVTKIFDKYPEHKERKRKIVSYDTAEKLLSKDLRAILRKMKKRNYI